MFKITKLSQFLLLALLALLPVSDLSAAPWSRATGEAVELGRTTRDLRNRAERLYPRSSVARHAVSVDQLADVLLNLTKSSVPQYELEAALTDFQQTLAQTQAIVGSDYRTSSDRILARYLKTADSRFDYLVKDLRRATPPAPTYGPPVVAYRPPAYAPAPHYGEHYSPYVQPYSSLRPSYSAEPPVIQSHPQPYHSENVLPPAYSSPAPQYVPIPPRISL